MSLSQSMNTQIREERTKVGRLTWGLNSRRRPFIGGVRKHGPCLRYLCVVAFEVMKSTWNHHPSFLFRYNIFFALCSSYPFPHSKYLSSSVCEQPTSFYIIFLFSNYELCERHLLSNPLILITLVSYWVLIIVVN